jgi:hypothetical protein
MLDQLPVYVLLCAAALVAGAMNSVAGGGTLLTFPALLLMVSPVTANATSTVALVPGSLAGAWGFRQEMKDARRWAKLLAWPSLLGGVVGSELVARMDEKYFQALIPWLILTATALFAAQPTIARLTGIGKPHEPPTGATVVGVMAFQFLVAVYGGYFGAGIGILMLSALALMGLADIHQMNAVKTFLAVCINGVSVLVFIWEGKVDWGLAAMMAVAAIAGGYLGARGSRRLSRNLVRWVVIAIGLFLACYFFSQQLLRTS